MVKNNPLGDLEKQNKKIVLAMLIAVFGILLFIAFALTLPWGK